MSRIPITVYAVPLTLVLLLAAGRAALGWWSWSDARAQRRSSDQRALAEAVVSNWTGPSRLAARVMIEKYGTPDEIKASRLTWTRCAPWKRTVVFDKTPLYVPTRLNVLEQTADYRVPIEAIRAVEAFSPDLVMRADKGELSALADSEETNFLAMNLAVEIARGLKTVKEAREFYERTLDFAASGKSSPYLERLLFLEN